MKKRFTEERIIEFLKQADTGVPVKQLCRQHDLSDASFDNWRAKLADMDISSVKQENGIIKKYWSPFLIKDQIVKTELDSEQPTPNGILALLTSPPQGTLVYTLLAATNYYYL